MFNNCANKLMALSMTMLCLCYAVIFWQNYDSAFGVYDPEDYTTIWTNSSCTSSEKSELPMCQVYAAGGSLVLLATVAAIYGGFRSKQQINQSAMAAAFSLINIALAVYYFVAIEQYRDEGHETIDGVRAYSLDELKDLSENMQAVIGAVHLLGFIFGFAYLTCVCFCDVGKANNFLYVIAMLCYLIAQVMNDYNRLDKIPSCSTNIKDISNVVEDELEKATSEGEEHDYSSQCAVHAISGTVLLLAAITCFIALILAFYQDAKKQGHIQQFALAFSVGLACLAQATQFWWAFSEGLGNGEYWWNYAECEFEDIFDSGACTAWAFGGIFGLLGCPFAIFTAFAFICGCMAEQGVRGAAKDIESGGCCGCCGDVAGDAAGNLAKEAGNEVSSACCGCVCESLLASVGCPTEL